MANVESISMWVSKYNKNQHCQTFLLRREKLVKVFSSFIFFGFNNWKGLESLKAIVCIYLKLVKCIQSNSAQIFSAKSWLFRGMSFSFIQLGSQTCAAMGLYNFPRLYLKCNNQHRFFFLCVCAPICQAHSPFLPICIQFTSPKDPMASQYKEIAVFSF